MFTAAFSTFQRGFLVCICDIVFLQLWFQVELVSGTSSLAVIEHGPFPFSGWSCEWRVLD